MKKQKDDKIKIDIPKEVKDILQRLTNANYEAYVVGGCVRDALMQKDPNDWDITTNAKPNEIQHLFEQTLDTGKVFGTITVVRQTLVCEVTTYRGESDYDDYRHPKQIWFSNRLEEDLKRRDFTVNAMAYNQNSGLVDLFDGKKDIENRILRCVGNPRKRFQEDPLRMLRAVRFSVACSFDVEHETEKAMIQCSDLLKHVSMERCRDELIKMLDEDAFNAVELLYHYQLLSVIFVGFKNFKENHCLETLRHAKTVEECLVIILRNLVFEKQGDCLEDYYKEILRYLKFSEADVVYIAKAAACQFKDAYHDVIEVRRAMAQYGVDVFQLAANIWRSENKDYNIVHIVDKMIDQNECISIQQLAVNGRDLMKLGFEQNQQLGETLKKLLDIVLVEPRKNKKEQLLMIAKQIKEKVET